MQTSQVQPTPAPCNCTYIFHRCLFHYKYISKTVQTSYHNLTFVSSVSIVSAVTALAMVGRQWQLIIANDTPVRIKKILHYISMVHTVGLYFNGSYCGLVYLSKLVHQLFCHLVVQCVTTFCNLGPSPPLLHFCFA